MELLLLRYYCSHKAAIKNFFLDLLGWVIKFENINVETQSGYLCRQNQTGGFNVNKVVAFFVDKSDRN